MKGRPSEHYIQYNEPSHIDSRVALLSHLLVVTTMLDYHKRRGLKMPRFDILTNAKFRETCNEERFYTHHR